MERCCQKCYEKNQGTKNCYDNKTSASENGRKFRVESKNKTICRLKIDGCIVTSEARKCDYVFVRCDNKDHYYVELKGSDIGKAYEQIVMTINHHISSPKDKNWGFIVCSKVPKAGTKVQKLKEEFKKKYGRRLEVKQNQYTHIIK